MENSRIEELIKLWANRLDEADRNNDVARINEIVPIIQALEAKLEESWE
jgi:flagellin-specific chaperone FliS